MLAGALTAADENRRIAEQAAASLQVDIDLAELRSDTTSGLLRLCRTLKGLPTAPQVRQVKTDFIHLELRGEQADASLRELREFVSLAVLANGQQFAPLLPPITHDGKKVVRFQLSPDGSRILTLGEDHTARLWDSCTVLPIAVLRRAGEQVFHGGFSPDGVTVFTNSPDGVVRLWDATDGTYRAETETRPHRAEGIVKSNFTDVSPGITQVAKSRLLTHTYEQIMPPSFTDAENIVPSLTGPVELWDTKTGRHIARLDRSEEKLECTQFHFAAEGRLIVAFRNGKFFLRSEDRDRDRSTVTIISPEDGRILGRLQHAEGTAVDYVYVSPSGRRIITQFKVKDFVIRYQIWDGDTWQAKPAVSESEYLTSGIGRFLSEEVFTGFRIAPGGNDVALFADKGSEPRIVATPYLGNGDIVGDRLHIGDGSLIDTQTWQRLPQPKGRRYHPDLSRFAADGHLVRVYQPDSPIDWIVYGLIDTQTEKMFEFYRSDVYGNSSDGYIPGFGWIAVVSLFNAPTTGVSQVRLVPQASDKFAPDMLELWAQVAVRGELGENGEFVKWKEATWEKKRQELAAIPAPRAEFPFPGYVARDRLHWLRAEYEAATTDGERLRLASDLLRRAEEIGDRTEMIRWQAERAKYQEVAPKPAEK